MTISYNESYYNMYYLDYSLGGFNWLHSDIWFPAGEDLEDIFYLFLSEEKEQAGI